MVPPEISGVTLAGGGATAMVRFDEPSMNRRFVEWFDRVTNWIDGELGIRSVILTGSRNVFMTGADLEEVRELHSRGEVEEFLRIPHALMRRVYGMGKITIAAINGFCLGGGLELAMICDFRVAADDARTPEGEELKYIGLPEIRLGLVPALGGVHSIATWIGFQKARQMLYRGDLATAREALEMGLVDRVCPREDVARVAIELGNGVCADERGRIAVDSMKRLLRPSGAEFEKALTRAGEAFADCCCDAGKDERIERVRRESAGRFRKLAAGGD